MVAIEAEYLKQSKLLARTKKYQTRTCKSEHVSISAGPFRLIGPGLVDISGASTVNSFELAADDRPARDLIFPATSDKSSPGIRVGATPNKMDNTLEDCHVQMDPRPSKPLPACLWYVTEWGSKKPICKHEYLDNSATIKLCSNCSSLISRLIKGY
jgi:hypothetical protein